MGRTRVSIRDTGGGLSAEKIKQLFQPFNRLGQEAGSEEGTGIGLVMSKRVVELMGGVIGVESTVGQGSVFWFELQAVSAPELEHGSTEPATVVHPNGPVDLPLRTVLYVEDNKANLKLVQQLISRRSDIRLLTAENGTLGIDLARRELPDVILMDINLPGISGIQALKILLEDPLTARIPVLAISANAMPRDIKIGMDAGFYLYLTKPIKVTEFMNALNASLEFATSRKSRPGI
jgi:CheY-like chemotaxis protein